MNIRHILPALLLTAALPAAADSFNAGCYNVRMRTEADKTAYPGSNRYWDNRAEAVAQTIKDLQYDIIGLNEVTDDPTVDGRTMWEDIKKMLPQPQWDYVAVNSKGDRKAKRNVVHCILYKTDKFELLDRGYFYHSPDTEHPAEETWDMDDHARMTNWGKFRVKATGQIFYFFELHAHHAGNIAKNEGYALTVDKARQIAGGYPCIVVGDHNSRPARPAFYEVYSAMFDDSYIVSPHNDGQELTCNNWSGLYGRLDYVWVNNVDVLDYRTSKEQYDLGFSPSDHLPVCATVQLRPVIERMDIYADASAPDGGDGSVGAPYNNLQQAINACPRGGRVLIAAGTYRPTQVNPLIQLTDDRNVSFHLPRTVTLIGGYDSDFGKITGRSVLTADLAGDDDYSTPAALNTGDNAYNVITAADRTIVELRNIEICGAVGTGNCPGGMWSRAARTLFDNVYVHHNSCQGNGAGVFAAMQLNAVNSVFSHNSTPALGGAVFAAQTGSGEAMLAWGSATYNGCLFEGNSAKSGSAVYFQGAGWTNIVNSTFTGNTASANGTVYLGGKATDTRFNLANSTFTGNAAARGAAVYLDEMRTYTSTTSKGAVCGIACNTILANTATAADGAAVNAANKVILYVNNNIIACNQPMDLRCAVDGTVMESNSNYNIYTSAASISHKVQFNDITGTDYADAAANLALLLDAEVTDGQFVPHLADNDGPTPTVAMISNKFGTKITNRLPVRRYYENEIKTDLNADMQVRVSITDSHMYDQRGYERNAAYGCRGAYEFNGKSDIAAPRIDAAGDRTPHYYNLQGIELTPDAAHGLVIVRRGAQAQKILLP